MSTTTATTPDGYGFAASVVTATPDTHPAIMSPDAAPVVATGAEDVTAATYADEVARFITQFWVAPSAASLDLIVLWTIGTHVRGRDGRPFLMESYPLLMLGSTGPASGKSTALRLICELAAKGEMVVDPTSPSLLNLAEDASTIGIDEMDTLLGAGAGSRNMRAHLLTSYTAGGKITRASGKETRKVDVHYPVVTAGMLKTFLTHPTLNALRTRFLTVHCRPIVPGPDAPTPVRFRERHRTFAVALREVMSAWAMAEGPRIATTAEYIDLPIDVRDRDAELWEPMFAVAECLGGDWPARCAAACEEITKGVPGEDAVPTSPTEWLLRDLSLVWARDDKGAPVARMTSAAIVNGLLTLPDSAWLRWLDANPDNPTVSGGKQLAGMLKGVGVAPKVMKISGDAHRGFALADLVAAGMPRPSVAADGAENDAPAAPVKPKRTRRNPSPKRAPGGPASPVTDA